MSDDGEGTPQTNSLAQTRNAPSTFPEDYRPIAWEGFESLNLKNSRAAINDNEMAWCDGWMPLGRNNLRALPDVGLDGYTAPRGTSIVWHGFGNIGDTPYGYALLSNGQLDGWNTQTGSKVTILPAGTIAAPSSIFGMSQWGSTFALFCKDQDNGYWLWDGTNVFTAGTMDPQPEITNAGLQYTSPPTIVFQTTGAGSGMAASAQITNQSVVKITIDTPGSGFAVDDFVVGTFRGGGSDDQATLLTNVHPDWGGLKEVVILQGGNGYTGFAYATVTGGDQDPSGDQAVLAVGVQNGAINQIAIIRKGSGYKTAPTITVHDPGIPNGPHGGSGFSGLGVLEFGQLSSITVSYGGTNYTSPPKIVIVGDGTGAAATAIIQAGAIIGVQMTDYGTGYTKALAIAQGGNNAANATFAVFPFAISGTSLETYQDHVFLSNGAAVAAFPPKARIIYSDPQTPTGFGNGGGGFLSNDSFLRVGYHWLRQSNGFLYLGGDSSTNYLSGVSTSAPSTGPPITTFSNQNVDPQIGSPWAASVQVFSRNIVLANPQGIYVSYGGAMTKVSTPLDPLYVTCPTLNSPAANFSAAVAQIFNTEVYMLLLPVIDRITRALTNKLLMWDGKHWFTSQQSKNLTFISTQEYNSNLIAWGTDGTTIFPLFQKPGVNFKKTVISKLYALGYWMMKTMVRLQGVVQPYTVDGQAVNVQLDSDIGGNNSPAPVYSFVPGGSGGAWYGPGGVPGTWTGAGGAVGSWPPPGIVPFGPLPVGQAGRLLGFTLSTNASDMAVLSILAEGQDYAALT